MSRPSYPSASSLAPRSRRSRDPIWDRRPGDVSVGSSNEARTYSLVMGAPVRLRGSARNLPAEVTSFVGRRYERSEVRRLLAESRLVTLVGFGGVGKTRLSLRAAADLQRSFPDGVCFVDLAAVRESTLVANAVAASLGLHTKPTTSAVDLLTDHLAPRRALIVLDNCEHLIEACAALVDALLRACADLRVLATSRQALAVAGEVLLDVPPLSVPPDAAVPDSTLTEYEAVRMFLDRARAIVPGFVLEPDNAELVATLCRQLNGIPLALELAAVRLRGLSLAQVLGRLTDRLRLLSGGNRVAPDRQRTLRGCIEWSYGLCTPEERDLWMRTSVFSGGFEIEAMEAVCTEPGNAHDFLETLLALVDKSIIYTDQSAGRMRYGMLEVIREYGEERLHDAGLEAALRMRHRDYYADLCSRWETARAGARQAQWMDRLRRDHPNIQAALEFSVQEPDGAETGLGMMAALREHWIVLGAFGEGCYWYDRLSAVGSAADVTLVRAQRTAAWLGLLQGDVEYAAPLIEEGKRLAAGMDDVTRAMFDNLAAVRAVYAGDLTRAVAEDERALAVFRKAGEVVLEANTLLSLHLVHSYAGNTDEVLQYHEECMALSDRIGDRFFRSYSIMWAGIAHLQRGETKTAVELLSESLRLKREIADQFGIAMCIEAMAWATAPTEPQRAVTLLGISASLSDAIGTRVWRTPWMAARHDACRERLVAALGEKGVRAAWEKGKGWSLEGVEYALRERRVQAMAGSSRGQQALTPRELEVARLVAQGMSNKDIATTLVVSPRTAEAHVEHILTKLGFSSRAQIATWISTS